MYKRIFTLVVLINCESEPAHAQQSQGKDTAKLSDVECNQADAIRHLKENSVIFIGVSKRPLLQEIVNNIVNSCQQKTINQPETVRSRSRSSTPVSRRAPSLKPPTKPPVSDGKDSNVLHCQIKDEDGTKCRTKYQSDSLLKHIINDITVQIKEIGQGHLQCKGIESTLVPGQNIDESCKLVFNDDLVECQYDQLLVNIIFDGDVKVIIKIVWYKQIKMYYPDAFITDHDYPPITVKTDIQTLQQCFNKVTDEEVKNILKKRISPIPVCLGEGMFKKSSEKIAVGETTVKVTSFSFVPNENQVDETILRILLCKGCPSIENVFVPNVVSERNVDNVIIGNNVPKSLHTFLKYLNIAKSALSILPTSFEGVKVEFTPNKVSREFEEMEPNNDYSLQNPKDIVVKVSISDSASLSAEFMYTHERSQKITMTFKQKDSCLTEMYPCKAKQCKELEDACCPYYRDHCKEGCWLYDASFEDCTKDALIRNMRLVHVIRGEIPLYRDIASQVVKSCYKPPLTVLDIDPVETSPNSADILKVQCSGERNLKEKKSIFATVKNAMTGNMGKIVNQNDDDALESFTDYVISNLLKMTVTDPGNQIVREDMPDIELKKDDELDSQCILGYKEGDDTCQVAKLKLNLDFMGVQFEKICFWVRQEITIKDYKESETFEINLNKLKSCTESFLKASTDQLDSQDLTAMFKEVKHGKPKCFPKGMFELKKTIDATLIAGDNNIFDTIYTEYQAAKLMIPYLSGINFAGIMIINVDPLIEPSIELTYKNCVNDMPLKLESVLEELKIPTFAKKVQFQSIENIEIWYRNRDDEFTIVKISTLYDLNQMDVIKFITGEENTTPNVNGELTYEIEGQGILKTQELYIKFFCTTCPPTPDLCTMDKKCDSNEDKCCLQQKNRREKECPNVPPNQCNVENALSKIDGACHVMKQSRLHDTLKKLLEKRCGNQHKKEITPIRRLVPLPTADTTAHRDSPSKGDHKKKCTSVMPSDKQSTAQSISDILKNMAKELNSLMESNINSDKETSGVKSSDKGSSGVESSGRGSSDRESSGRGSSDGESGYEPSSENTSDQQNLGEDNTSTEKKIRINEDEKYKTMIKKIKDFITTKIGLYDGEDTNCGLIQIIGGELLKSGSDIELLGKIKEILNNCYGSNNLAHDLSPPMLSIDIMMNLKMVVSDVSSSNLKCKNNDKKISVGNVIDRNCELSCDAGLDCKTAILKIDVALGDQVWPMCFVWGCSTYNDKMSKVTFNRTIEKVPITPPKCMQEVTVMNKKIYGTQTRCSGEGMFGEGEKTYFYPIANQKRSTKVSKIWCLKSSWVDKEFCLTKTYELIPPPQIQTINNFQNHVCQKLTSFLMKLVKTSKTKLTKQDISNVVSIYIKSINNVQLAIENPDNGRFKNLVVDETIQVDKDLNIRGNVMDKHNMLELRLSFPAKKTVDFAVKLNGITCDPKKQKCCLYCMEGSSRKVKTPQCCVQHHAESKVLDICCKRALSGAVILTQDAGSTTCPLSKIKKIEACAKQTEEGCQSYQYTSACANGKYYALSKYLTDSGEEIEEKFPIGIHVREIVQPVIRKFKPEKIKPRVSNDLTIEFEKPLLRRTICICRKTSDSQQCRISKEEGTHMIRSEIIIKNTDTTSDTIVVTLKDCYGNVIDKAVELPINRCTSPKVTDVKPIGDYLEISFSHPVKCNNIKQNKRNTCKVPYTAYKEYHFPANSVACEGSDIYEKMDHKSQIDKLIPPFDQCVNDIVAEIKCGTEFFLKAMSKHNIWEIHTEDKEVEVVYSKYLRFTTAGRENNKITKITKTAEDKWKRSCTATYEIPDIPAEWFNFQNETKMSKGKEQVVVCVKTCKHVKNFKLKVSNGESGKIFTTKRRCFPMGNELKGNKPVIWEIEATCDINGLKLSKKRSITLLPTRKELSVNNVIIGGESKRERCVNLKKTFVTQSFKVQPKTYRLVAETSDGSKPEILNQTDNTLGKMNITLQRNDGPPITTRIETTVQMEDSNQNKVEGIKLSLFITAKEFCKPVISLPKIIHKKNQTCSRCSVNGATTLKVSPDTERESSALAEHTVTKKCPNSRCIVRICQKENVTEPDTDYSYVITAQNSEEDETRATLVIKKEKPPCSIELNYKDFIISVDFIWENISNMGTPKNCRVARQSPSGYTDAETIELYTIPIPGQEKQYVLCKYHYMDNNVKKIWVVRKEVAVLEVENDISAMIKRTVEKCENREEDAFKYGSITHQMIMKNVDHCKISEEVRNQLQQLGRCFNITAINEDTELTDDYKATLLHLFSCSKDFFETALNQYRKITVNYPTESKRRKRRSITYNENKYQNNGQLVDYSQVDAFISTFSALLYPITSGNTETMDVFNERAYDYQRSLCFSANINEFESNVATTNINSSCIITDIVNDKLNYMLDNEAEIVFDEKIKANYSLWSCDEDDEDIVCESLYLSVVTMANFENADGKLIEPYSPVVNDQMALVSNVYVIDLIKPIELFEIFRISSFIPYAIKIPLKSMENRDKVKCLQWISSNWEMNTCHTSLGTLFVSCSCTENEPTALFKVSDQYLTKNIEAAAKTDETPKPGEPTNTPFSDKYVSEIHKASSAGTPPSSGIPMSNTSHSVETPSAEPLSSKFYEFRFFGDFETIEFQYASLDLMRRDICNQVKDQLKISEHKFTNCSAWPGSIIIKFTVTDTASNMDLLKETIQHSLDEETVVLADPSGELYYPDERSLKIDGQPYKEKDNGGDKTDNDHYMYIVIGAAVMLVVVIIVVVIYMHYRKKNKSKSDKESTPRSPAPSYDQSPIKHGGIIYPDQPPTYDDTINYMEDEKTRENTGRSAQVKENNVRSNDLGATQNSLESEPVHPAYNPTYDYSETKNRNDNIKQRPNSGQSISGLYPPRSTTAFSNASFCENDDNNLPQVA